MLNYSQLYKAITAIGPKALAELLRCRRGPPLALNSPSRCRGKINTARQYLNSLSTRRSIARHCASRKVATQS